MASSLTKRREPYKFMMGVAIVGMALLFLSLSFLYIIRKSGSNWNNFALPNIFWVSTCIIIASSGTLQVAMQAFKKEQFLAYRWLIGATLSLGAAFIVTQILGWKQIFDSGFSINKSVASAFLYTLSGLHILHIAGGLIYLAVTLSGALKRPSYVDSFVYSVNPPTQLRLKLVSIYWHFVDALWIYLFLFLLYHHN